MVRPLIASNSPHENLPSHLHFLPGLRRRPGRSSWRRWLCVGFALAACAQEISGVNTNWTLSWIYPASPANGVSQFDVWWSVPGQADPNQRAWLCSAWPPANSVALPGTLPNPVNLFVTFKDAGGNQSAFAAPYVFDTNQWAAATTATNTPFYFRIKIACELGQGTNNWICFTSAPVKINGCVSLSSNTP